MPSTYTSRIRLEKQADGENPNSWGLIVNQNVIDLVDEAIGGYAVVSVSSVPVSLTTANGATDQSRQASLEFAGILSAVVTITIPSQEKTYFIRDNTTQISATNFAVEMKTAGGTGVRVNNGTNIFVACDGTDIYKLESATSVSTFTANTLNATQITATSVATSVLNVSATASITTLVNTSITTSVVSATQMFATSVATSVITGATATFSGTVSAAYFDGDGSNLTNLPGGSITLTNASQFSSDGGAVTKNAVQSFAKMWCNFNGQGTPAFRDSFNGSSITDNGTGDYGINMTSAMSNTDYSSHATSAFDSGAQIGNGVGEVCAPNSTTKVEYGSGNTAGAYDQLINQCAVFGDLA